jgi:hypothetical protein
MYGSSMLTPYLREVVIPCGKYKDLPKLPSLLEL